ncbi:MAG: cytochrome P450 [Phycisphaeraceae bacterium]
MPEPDAPRDPFKQARESDGVMCCPFMGEPIAMMLRYNDVRAAAKDWRSYSSDAAFRVPIPSEETMRSVRQLPIEADPPDHAEWRRIADPFFQRPRTPAMAEQIASLVDRLLREAIALGEVEAVRGFALPLQSKALAYLLNVDEDEADEWIGWGTHVFHDGDDVEAKGGVLEAYLNRRLDRALAEPGDDFFTALTRAEFRGRALTRGEMLGFANLAFAGGRDTIIHSVAEVLAYFAGHADQLGRIRREPRLVRTASEEFVRVLSPLTSIGRVCPRPTEVHGVAVPADHRVALCWASANYDAGVFDTPDEVRLDRVPNPHLAYGTGPHNCLGVHHARLLLRTLLSTLAQRVGSVTLLDSRPNIEVQQTYRRRVGYQSLRLRLVGR